MNCVHAVALFPCVRSADTVGVLAGPSRAHLRGSLLGAQRGPSFTSDRQMVASVHPGKLCGSREQLARNRAASPAGDAIQVLRRSLALDSRYERSRPLQVPSVSTCEPGPQVAAKLAPLSARCHQQGAHLNRGISCADR